MVNLNKKVTSVAAVFALASSAFAAYTVTGPSEVATENFFSSTDKEVQLEANTSAKAISFTGVLTGNGQLFSFSLENGKFIADLNSSEAYAVTTEPCGAKMDNNETDILSSKVLSVIRKAGFGSDSDELGFFLNSQNSVQKSGYGYLCRGDVNSSGGLIDAYADFNITLNKSLTTNDDVILKVKNGTTNDEGSKVIVDIVDSYTASVGKTSSHTIDVKKERKKFVNGGSDVNVTEKMEINVTIPSTTTTIAIQDAIAGQQPMYDPMSTLDEYQIKITGDFSGVQKIMHDKNGDDTIAASESHLVTSAERSAGAVTITGKLNPDGSSNPRKAGAIFYFVVDGTTVLDTGTYTATLKVKDDARSADGFQDEALASNTVSTWNINGYQAMIPYFNGESWVRFINSSSTEAEIFVELFDDKGNSKEIDVTANVLPSVPEAEWDTNAPTRLVGKGAQVYFGSEILKHQGQGKTASGEVYTGEFENTQRLRAVFTVTAPNENVEATGFQKSPSTGNDRPLTIYENTPTYNATTTSATHRSK